MRFLRTTVGHVAAENSCTRADERLRRESEVKTGVWSAARSMDDATLQTLKSWKFKPAMCGSEPVVSDIAVVVSFRLRQ